MALLINDRWKMIILDLNDETIKTLLHNAYTSYLEGLWVYGDKKVLQSMKEWENTMSEVDISIIGKHVVIIDQDDK